jgi:hypothetical protein
LIEPVSQAASLISSIKWAKRGRDWCEIASIGAQEKGTRKSKHYMLWSMGFAALFIRKPVTNERMREVAGAKIVNLSLTKKAKLENPTSPLGSIFR